MSRSLDAHCPRHPDRPVWARGVCSSCYPALRGALMRRGRWRGRPREAETGWIGGRALGIGSVWRLNPEGHALAGLVGRLIQITPTALVLRVQVRGVGGVLRVSRALAHETLLPL